MFVQHIIPNSVIISLHSFLLDLYSSVKVQNRMTKSSLKREKVTVERWPKLKSVCKCVFLIYGEMFYAYINGNCGHQVSM